MKNNKLVNFYHVFFKSREADRDEKLVYELINNAIKSGNIVYDLNMVNRYMKDPQFVEKSIIEYLINMDRLDINTEYLSLYVRQMNASATQKAEDRIIIMDELLTYTTLSFFLTVYSYAYDNSEENEQRCIKNMYSILEIQGKKHEIAVHDIEDIQKMISLPDNIINLAMDTFWTAWTFIIGHELFHLSVNFAMNELQEEYEADAYGYQLLLHMIANQKRGKVPENIQVYFENMYLTPVMLFQYFSIIDEYRKKSGELVEYIDHPSPEERQKHIFGMFENEVPDDFNTDEGNEILNIFLESLEILKKKVYQSILESNI